MTHRSLGSRGRFRAPRSMGLRKACGKRVMAAFFRLCTIDLVVAELGMQEGSWIRSARQPMGFTLIEVVTVCFIVAIASTIALPTIKRAWDRLVVRQAAHDLALFYQEARFGAIARATRVRIEFGADTLRAVYEGEVDATFLSRSGPARLGVAFSASREVIRLHPNGFGWGAANTTLVVRRGSVAESLTTSRLGRIRRWR